MAGGCCIPDCIPKPDSKDKKISKFSVKHPKFAKTPEERQHRENLMNIVLSIRDISKGDDIKHLIHRERAAICERHFLPEDIYIFSEKSKRLQLGAIPVLHMPKMTYLMQMRLKRRKPPKARSMIIKKRPPPARMSRGSQTKFNVVADKDSDDSFLEANQELNDLFSFPNNTIKKPAASGRSTSTSWLSSIEDKMWRILLKLKNFCTRVHESLPTFLQEKYDVEFCSIMLEVLEIGELYKEDQHSVFKFNCEEDVSNDVDMESVMEVDDDEDQDVSTQISLVNFDYDCANASQNSATSHDQEFDSESNLPEGLLQYNMPAFVICENPPPAKKCQKPKIKWKKKPPMFKEVTKPTEPKDNAIANLSNEQTKNIGNEINSIEQPQPVVTQSTEMFKAPPQVPASNAADIVNTQHSQLLSLPKLTRTCTQHTLTKEEEELFKDCEIAHPIWGVAYKCPLCGSTYDKRNKLMKHDRCFHKKLYQVQCNICQKFIGHKHSLRNHLCTHMPTCDRKYSCTSCGMKFNQKPHWKKHMGSPTACNFPSYECKICHERFFKDQHVEKHLRDEHLNNNSKCDLCNGCVTEKCIQENHVIDLLKLYKCKFCEERFTFKKDFCKHTRRTHEQEIYDTTTFHKCTFCKKTFSELYYLNKHLARHIGVKNYWYLLCEYCPETFATKAELILHAKSMHLSESNT